MSDITTRWDGTSGDWAVSIFSSLSWTDERGNSVIDQYGHAVSSDFSPGLGLLSGDDLFTAVVISLFTDATAAPDDSISDGTDDPRGWWAGPIGSKLWLRGRSKSTATTAALIKDDIERALAWLVDDDVAASVVVETQWLRGDALGARVSITRADGTQRVLTYTHLWDDL